MKDLTNLKTYIIDSEDPHEVDDAISLEITEGEIKKLWVHISNPCRLFSQDSKIDLDTGELIWSKRSSSRFNSQIKIIGKNLITYKIFINWFAILFWHQIITLSFIY